MPECKCKPSRPGQPKPGPRALPTLLVAAAGLLLMAGLYLWILGGTAPPQTAAIGGPFRLTSADGRTVTDQSFRGRYVLVYFGYTACQDVCPLTLGAVAAALDELGARGGRVQPLFVTVDPRRDTPEVLRQYVASFSPRLIGLTGTPDQLHSMRQGYRVTGIVHPGSAGPGGAATAEYTIDHSSLLYLLGPDGRYLAPIRADESGAEMARDIAGHLS